MMNQGILLWGILLMIGNTVYGQVIYRSGYANSDFTEIIIFRYDVHNEKIDTLSIQAPGDRAQNNQFFWDNIPLGVGFHPNGKLLLAARYNMIEIDLKTRTSRWLTDHSYDGTTRLTLFENAFSNENGDITGAGFHGIFKYDYFTMKIHHLTAASSPNIYSYFENGLFLQVGSTFRNIQTIDPTTNLTSDYYVYPVEDIVGLLDIARYYDNNYNLHLLSMA